MVEQDQRISRAGYINADTKKKDEVSCCYWACDMLECVV